MKHFLTFHFLDHIDSTVTHNQTSLFLNLKQLLHHSHTAHFVLSDRLILKADQNTHHSQEFEEKCLGKDAGDACLGGLCQYLVEEV